MSNFSSCSSFKNSIVGATIFVQSTNIAAGTLYRRHRVALFPSRLLLYFALSYALLFLAQLLYPGAK